VAAPIAVPARALALAQPSGQPLVGSSPGMGSRSSSSSRSSNISSNISSTTSSHSAFSTTTGKQIQARPCVGGDISDTSDRSVSSSGALASASVPAPAQAPASASAFVKEASGSGSGRREGGTTAIVGRKCMEISLPRSPVKCPRDMEWWCHKVSENALGICTLLKASYTFILALMVFKSACKELSVRKRLNHECFYRLTRYHGSV
jgi:hypothetical protein